MKADDLINFRALSVFLTGKPENVRKGDKLRPKYDSVNKLIKSVRKWMDEQKETPLD